MMRNSAKAMRRTVWSLGGMGMGLLVRVSGLNQMLFGPNDTQPKSKCGESSFFFECLVQLSSISLLDRQAANLEQAQLSGCT
mgnify:CR=1 FL=1